MKFFNFVAAAVFVISGFFAADSTATGAFIAQGVVDAINHLDDDANYKLVHEYIHQLYGTQSSIGRPDLIEALKKHKEVLETYRDCASVDSGKYATVGIVSGLLFWALKTPILQPIAGEPAGYLFLININGSNSTINPKIARLFIPACLSALVIGGYYIKYRYQQINGDEQLMRIDELLALLAVTKAQ
jgi:hypothetical protein